jgi:hypothetical protein
MEIEEKTFAAAKAHTLFERLPPWVVDSLSASQQAAIRAALAEPEWKIHPINIRFSLPFVKRRYYLTIVGGEDNRSAARLTHDRRKYPLRTLANIFFVLGVATVFYTIALIALALHSAILEI